MNNYFSNNKGLTTIAIVLIIVGAVVVVGGVLGGVIGYNAYQEKKQQEENQADEKKLEEDRNNVVKAYNDRIDQIVASLNVEKKGTASIDNNDDVDAMTNAVSELNNIANEINNNSVLTQEQKDALNNSIESNKNAINNRINVVNEKNSKIRVKYQDLVGGLTYGQLKAKYGDSLKIEERGPAYYKYVWVPQLGVYFVFSTESKNDFQLTDSSFSSRIAGKLSDIADGVNKNISAEEFANKLESNKGKASYEIKQGSGTFDTIGEYYIVVNFSGTYNLNSNAPEVVDGTVSNSFGASLYIVCDSYGNVSPDSWTYFDKTAG